MMIQMQREPIDYASLTERVRSHSCGAVCLFLGTVREMTAGKQTQSLAYEAHESLAQKMLSQIEAETRLQFPVHELAIVHRVGHLELGEISVAVAVSSAHRKDAFAACQYAMDRVKQIAPIWKQEHWADGTTEWVHPVEM